MPKKPSNTTITFRLTPVERRRLEVVLGKAQRKNELITMSHLIRELLGFRTLRKPILSDDDREYLAGRA